MKFGLRVGTLMLVVSGGVISAQTPGQGATKGDAEVQKESLQAEELYQQQNFLGALPLFEDLHQQRPQSNVFRERLAMTLLAKQAPRLRPTRQRHGSVHGSYCWMRRQREMTPT